MSNNEQKEKAGSRCVYDETEHKEKEEQIKIAYRKNELKLAACCSLYLQQLEIKTGCECNNIQ
ncbi:hypothetical protein BpHYR1_001139 [Brachionus plicatilis]|uniref:Uncharacterized protein n=1 Tax=Brachionus plicatilis TaxID=10195 RepID=A0A3M7Q855_BRAPC|nr:hypothetical protein BpHYR1_001139 [Brachionus plicatilis]